MNCINEDTINRLLDFDLTEEEMDSISAHLEECDTCLDKVMDAAASDKELISVLTGPGKTVLRFPRREGCLSKKLLLGYIVKGLNDADEKLVETHLEECDFCLTEIGEMQKSHLKKTELHFDTGALISALKDVRQEDILTIVLKDVGRRIFEVIETTGMILTNRFPAMEAARGKKPPPEAGGVHIRKDFPDKNISVEVSVGKGDKPETCDIRLSLMEMKGSEVIGVMESAKVNISVAGSEMSAVTDKSGEVEFKDLSYGGYRIEAVDGCVLMDVRVEKRSV